MNTKKNFFYLMAFLPFLLIKSKMTKIKTESFDSLTIIKEKKELNLPQIWFILI